MPGKKRSGKFLDSILDFFRTEGGLEGKEITKPSAPELGYNRIYPKADGWYTLNYLGVEEKLGIGQGIAETDLLRYLELTFNYQSEFPVLLVNVEAGIRVRKVILVVDTAFDDPSSLLSVGHTGNNGGLMSTGDNYPSIEGTYEVEPNFLYGGSDHITFYATVGSSTQGSGTVLLEFVNN
jgi:hypothetical protein